MGSSPYSNHDNVDPAPASYHIPNPNHASRGFVQTFGLHPMVSLLTIATDQMLFAGETVTLGMFLPISLTVSAAVGFLAYRAQMKFYHDDSEAAGIKAGMLALLCAIPTGLPMIIYGSLGVLGLFRRKG